MSAGKYISLQGVFMQAHFPSLAEELGLLMSAQCPASVVRNRVPGNDVPGDDVPGNDVPEMVLPERCRSIFHRWNRKEKFARFRGKKEGRSFVILHGVSRKFQAARKRTECTFNSTRLKNIVGRVR